MSRFGERTLPRATIVDVAREAGVSTATVSRYLNTPELVTAATAERIAQAIGKLGYIPNILAGNLAGSSSRMVGLVVPSLTNSIVEETVETLVSRLSGCGIVPMLGVTHLDPARLMNFTIAALGMRVVALIFTNVIPPELRQILHRAGTTVIEIWGLPREPLDVAIGFSHTEIGHALAAFAHEKGYRAPHLVSASSVRGQIRGAAFAERWHQLAGTEPTAQEIPIPLLHGHAEEVLHTIGRLDRRPDLLVVGSDILAYSLVLRLRDQGVAVPGDVAVIGFGDLGLATAGSPPLTTVRIDGAQIADKVMEVMDMRARGVPLPENRINCGFTIVRRGTA